jgi:hypothetical protein
MNSGNNVNNNRNRKKLQKPIIVQTLHGTDAKIGFEDASPYLVGHQRALFLSALRRNQSLLKIVPASSTFNKTVTNSGHIRPESCISFTEANSTGYYLKNVLPLVFVKTRKGEVLPDSRVALKYLRENEKEFNSVLQIINRYSDRIFRSSLFKRLKSKYPILFSDVCQPYSSFSDEYMTMKGGFYVMTPPGIATMLGPPINLTSQLNIYSGVVETDFYHSELFCVFDCPQFEERVLIIEPDSIIAQFYFIAKDFTKEAIINFSRKHLGATPLYRSRSLEAGLKQVKEGRKAVYSKLKGVKSVDVSCPHCWVSITTACEKYLPDDHIKIHDFYQGYKDLRNEYHKLKRANNHSQ